MLRVGFALWPILHDMRGIAAEALWLKLWAYEKNVCDWQGLDIYEVGLCILIFCFLIFFFSKFFFGGWGMENWKGGTFSA